MNRLSLVTCNSIVAHPANGSNIGSGSDKGVPMSALEELEQAIARVAEKAGGAVVGIGRGPGRGSGIVLADGRVATNAHNLRGEEVTVVAPEVHKATDPVQGVDLDSR